VSNSGYYATVDENFNQAYKLITSEQNHAELIEMLKCGNIVQKQLAALKLETVLNEDEAQILIDNLTGQDGKVREAVSLKINELMHNTEVSQLFDFKKNVETFLDAIIDINGNICRNIISALSTLIENPDFCNLFCPKLLDRTLRLAEIVKDFDFQEGKYKVNKEVFKLYWYLETIYIFAYRLDLHDLKKILSVTKSINEYTIREKTAKILTRNFQDFELDEIREILKNDTNYYVRRF